MALSSLYPILDFSCFAAKADPRQEMLEFAGQLLVGGATILQYRDKISDPQTFLSNARELRRVTQGRATFILNDRADLALACEADGVHLGQDDLSPEAARKIFDSANKTSGHAHYSWIGFSTHNLAQVRQAGALPLDYIAIGPVFATGSKANPDPVVGLEGVRRAREATRRPLVAIGGITRQNCRQVRDVGADSVAVISDLLESPAKAVEEFLRLLG